MKTYEAMFLLDGGNSDFEAASVPVREVLARAQAEVLSMKPWDERRLAYDIKGRKRGLYVLTYFRADPTRLAELEHDIQLDERILRAMVLSADHVSEEKIHAETPATLAMARRVAAEQQRARKEEQAREAAEAAESGQPEPPAAEAPPPAADEQQTGPAEPAEPAREAEGQKKDAPEQKDSKD